MKQLAADHETEIAERGVNLSGGQKALDRLARAMYAMSEVLFLEDPLAAVVPKVASQLVYNLHPSMVPSAVSPPYPPRICVSARRRDLLAQQ